MSLEFWRWRFLDNPAGGPLIELAWSRDELVGHYAVSPVILSIKGNEIKSALSVTTMTHPDYRGHGIICQLAKRLYKRLEDMGFYAVWGFPNRNFHGLTVRHLNWHDISDIPMFVKSMDVCWDDHGATHGCIEIINEFDAKNDALWKKDKDKIPIQVARYSDYLNWRFMKNPSVKYTALCYYRDDEVLGHAVVSKYNEIQWQIVDLYGGSDTGVVVELIKAVELMAREAGAKRLAFWVPVAAPIHTEVDKLGFEGSAPITYLGGRCFKNLPGKTDFYNSRNWYNCLSDSDNF
jgi:hypothetical protein